MFRIKIKRVSKFKIPLFERMTSGAACLDVFAHVDKPVRIACGQIRKIPLGFAVQMPADIELLIRPRSGLMVKNSVIGMFGTIDSDYRDEVHAILLNAGQEVYRVQPGDRVSQITFKRVYTNLKLIMVDKLDDTDRGTGGFGHTGR